MSLPLILEKYRPEIDREIRAVIDSRSSPLYNMMRYHFGWIDREGRPARGDSGKALRPALCLFSCEAAGGDYRNALPAAAALELLHNFSLIHDDIQDDDRERRHRPTVWAVWGKPQAINAGTAMRILAGEALFRLPEETVPPAKRMALCRLLDETTLKLIEGQYLDISFEKRFDIGIADYLTMISGKTAALISAAMETGARLGTNNEYLINVFGGAGRKLGLAFQVRDDILGIWGDERETGKPAGSDIRRHKKSFPVVYSLDNLGGRDKQELISLYQDPSMDDSAVRRVLAIFDSVDARTGAQKMVDSYCEAAVKEFNSLKIASKYKQDLSGLVQFLTGRTY